MLKRIQTAVFPHAWAVLLFIAVYIMLSWPLVTHMGGGILGSYEADGWEEIEQFWWFKHAIVDEGISPVRDPKIFYPEGWNLVTGSHSPSLMIPTIPFTMVMGPVAAFNVTMMLGYLFAAMGTYLLIYRLTKDQLAGLVAGVAYAFCMSRLLRIGGHFNTQTGSAWIPWVFLCLEIARERNGRSRLIWTALSGLCYAGSVLSYFYYVYIVAIPMAVYFLIEVWAVRQHREKAKQIVAAALLAFGVAAVFVAPFAFWALAARNEVGVSAYSLENTSAAVVSLERLVLPNRHHPVYGAWMRERFPDVGENSFVSLGITAVLLSVIGLIKRSHPRNRTYLILAIVTIIMGMGPGLYWNNEPVTFSFPGSDELVGIPLPGLLFFKYAPLFNVIRVWARFALVSVFAVAVLAGLTAAYLRPRVRGGFWLSIVLLLLVIFESFGHPFAYVPAANMVREVDQWVAAQPSEVAIMELPLNDRLNGSVNYSRMLHDHAIATGYATAMPASFLAEVRRFGKFPNQKTIKTLQKWHVDYLLYTVRDVAIFEETLLPEIELLDDLAFVAQFNGYPGEQVYVYEVR